MRRRRAGKATVIQASAEGVTYLSRDIDDENVLLDLVQRQTFRFFGEGAHPVSGLARARQKTTAIQRMTLSLPAAAVADVKHGLSSCRVGLFCQ
jgi:hypothetical protein